MLYLLLGVFALPLWTSILKLVNYLSDLYRCKLQEQLAHHKIQFLNHKYLTIQCIETVTTVFAYIILLWNLEFGLVLILLSNALNAITRAYFVAYSTLVDDAITGRKANNRTEFYARLDKVANQAAIVGALVNALIYYTGFKLGVNEIEIYYFFCCFYATTKIIDLVCSFVEKKEIDKLLRRNEIE
ncbi:MULTISPECIES: hypothetical protein [unclassified Fusobacterium]|uniref:hypothetical protein n=1 Tax=unclassified Fusobacterium TaxID=2648384 RepID=UPI001B8CFCA8|nr:MULTISPECIES: hypothetical protein [unclassified Fusobacterium]